MKLQNYEYHCEERSEKKVNLNPINYFSISHFSKALKDGFLNEATVFEKCAVIEGDLVKSPIGFEDFFFRRGGGYAT